MNFLVVGMTMEQQNLRDVMSDTDLMDAIEALREQEPNGEVGELLKMMSENRIIGWEEAEQILGGGTYECPIKSSLPQQTRPTEPDNDTDVDWSIQQLQLDNPKLIQVNLNNMKRTPIPQVKRLLSAIKDNTHLEKIALANMGLYDHDCEPIFDVLENNTTLKSINLETNYLSGDFFARLFRAALVNQTLEEVKAVNQGVTFATTAEREIIDAIFENRGLIKVSINLRLPEGRHKIEKAMIRNQEIRRILRRQAAMATRAVEETPQFIEDHKKPVFTVQNSGLSNKTLPVKPTIISNACQIPVVGKQPPGVRSSVSLVRESVGKVQQPVNGDGDDRIVLSDLKKVTTKKASSKKVKVENNTAISATKKPKLKKTAPKKKLIEHATPELEFDADEVPKKTTKSGNDPFGTKERSVFHVANGSSETHSNTIPILTNGKDFGFKSIKSTTEIVEGKSSSPTVAKDVPVPHSDDKKPAQQNKRLSTRNSTLVPAIFLAADQSNGPVKRNFTIPKKKDSTERETVAMTLAALRKSSISTNPFKEPMQVYPLKRDSISKPSTLQ